MQADSFDCHATAAVLRSGGVASLAGHVAMALSVIHAREPWLSGSASLIWLAVVYLSIRVNIDAHLFEVLALHSPEQLDGWLNATGLRKAGAIRTLEDRRRGALRLWRALLGAVAMQIVFMIFSLLGPWAA